jgi:hypothetical protein
MPQLNYTQNAIPGMPGMAFDLEATNRDVVSLIASVDIPFGAYLEVIQTGSQAGFCQPAQDATVAGAFATALAIAAAGIALFDPLGGEENYTSWKVPLVLAGTVLVTNNSTAVTFSANQTLPAGAEITFASQPGALYFLAAPVTAGTAGVLTQVYSGVTAAATTTTQIGSGSTSVGWRQGTAVPVMRKGRIWGLGDGAGVSQRGGPINLNHSSTGAFPMGALTFSAVSATAGHEIDIAPGVSVWNPLLIGGAGGPVFTDSFGNTFRTYPVEISL